MADYLFISYCRKDEETVGRLAGALRDAGYLIWLDSVPDDIPGGSPWAQKIVQAIRGAAVFVLVVSRHSMASDEVCKELHLAMEYKIQVIPLELDGTRIADKFAYHLAGIQRIDFTIDWQEGLDQLFKVLRDSDDARTAEESGIDPEVGRRLQAVIDDGDLEVADKSEQLLTLMNDHVWDQERRALAALLEKQARSDALWSQRLEFSDQMIELYDEIAKNDGLSARALRALRKEVRILKSKMQSIDRERESLEQAESTAKRLHATCQERRRAFQRQVDGIAETERDVLKRLLAR